MARRIGPAALPTTALLCVLFLTTLTPEASAQQGTWLVNVEVDAFVCDGYAIVETTAHIRNRGPDPEFPFVVQVPVGALVTNLTIVRDGEVYHATIADREEARQAYEEHKADEKTGGLVEKQRGSQAFAYLINVAEFEEVRATLRYEVYLSAMRGIMDLPLEAPVSGFGEDMGATFEVRLCPGEAVTAWADPAGQTWTDSAGRHMSYGVGSRPTDDATPWNVHFTREATPASGAIVAAVHADTGYFAHRFQAAPDPDRLPADIVLVLDTSGSMGGDKMLQLQDAARQLVASLGVNDRLHLAFFSSTVNSAWNGLVPMDNAGRAAGVDAIDAVFAGGGTNIEAGLLRAYETVGDAEAERTPLVVLLSDGQATVGQPVRDRVSERASEGVRLFSIAFGADADWSLLYGLAELGQGIAERIEAGAGAEADIQRFMEAWTTPVLRNVQIDYDEGIEALVQDIDILFSGSELLVAGTFEPALQVISGTVRADAADGPFEQTFSFTVADGAVHPLLARLVVFQQIQTLQDRYAAGDATAEAPLRALALQHGFVTDLTSLVLLLPASGPSETGTSTAAGSTATMTATTTTTNRLSSTGTSSAAPAADDTATGTSTPGPGILGAAAALAAVALLRRRRA